MQVLLFFLDSDKFVYTFLLTVFTGANCTKEAVEEKGILFCYDGVYYLGGKLKLEIFIQLVGAGGEGGVARSRGSGAAFGGSH
jgi:hypothetical protein